MNALAHVRGAEEPAEPVGDLCGTVLPYRVVHVVYPLNDTGLGDAREGSFHRTPVGAEAQFDHRHGCDTSLRLVEMLFMRASNEAAKARTPSSSSLAVMASMSMPSDFSLSR